MLYYVVMNRTKCCKKPICSECYLQVRWPSIDPTPTNHPTIPK